MDNNNNSGVNTILIVIVLVIVVGTIVWFVSGRAPANDAGLNVDVNLPESVGDAMPAGDEAAQ
jgi:uncharacterized membrane protein YqiK